MATEQPMRSVRLAEAVPLSLIADWLSAVLPTGAAGLMVQGVATDTRTLQAGDIFIALRGAQFDAHDFLAEVRDAGAVGAIVEAGHPALASPALDGWPLLICDDTRLALGVLGQAWRQRYALPLIAITGSNGKTTTKELLLHLCRAVAGEAAVLGTLGNFNNEIGLPLTLLRLGPQHRYAVIELGMSHPGEIAALAQWARPDIAIVTNAQRAHLAGMGTLAEVAAEKGSLYAALPADGTAIVNLDDAHSGAWLAQLQETSCRVLTTQVVDAGHVASATNMATLSAEILEATATGQHLRITTPAGESTINLPLAGRHNASNALQALAAGTAAGLDMTLMMQSLETFDGVAGRLQHKTGINGALLIDDTYNANPDSMRAAIDVLAGAARGDTVLVIGDMGEIGPEAEALHAEVGRYAAMQGVAVLYAVGPLAAAAVVAYVQHGAGLAQHFSTQEALVNALRPLLTPASRVLVKGSRSARMENVVNALVAHRQE